MNSAELPILQIKHVSKIYQRGPVSTCALDNVSLDIKKGEIFALLGVNGAGKTTLSSIIAALHPVSSGDVLFKDRSIYVDIATYRRALGLCPQKQNLDTYLTVQENLLFAGRYFLMHETDIARRAHELMEQLRLLEYKDHHINQLSGGTKQRVLIARALMHNPEIIILDEPTVGLDPDVRRKLWDVIKGLKARGATVILTTHYLDEAEYLADRICMLNEGKVMLIESVQELQARHGLTRLEDIFLKLTQKSQE